MPILRRRSYFLLFVSGFAFEMFAVFAGLLMGVLKGKIPFSPTSPQPSREKRNRQLSLPGAVVDPVGESFFFALVAGTRRAETRGIMRGRACQNGPKGSARLSFLPPQRLTPGRSGNRA